MRHAEIFKRRVQKPQTDRAGDTLAHEGFPECPLKQRVTRNLVWLSVELVVAVPSKLLASEEEAIDSRVTACVHKKGKPYEDTPLTPTRL